MNAKSVNNSETMKGIIKLHTHYSLHPTLRFLSLVLCSLLLAGSLQAQTWGPDVRITTAGVGAYEPDIIVWSDYIHVVWRDMRDSNAEIYYKHSTNNGQNWTSGIRLTNDAAYSEYPVVTCHDQNVHVVWSDNRTGASELFRRRSTDNGATWDPSVIMTTAGHRADYPSIAMQQNTIHVVWRDTRDANFEIYYKRSTNNGQNWTSGIRLTDDIAQSWSPVVACHDQNVHVVWRDDRTGVGELFRKRSTDNGATWDSSVMLTTAGHFACYPSIAMQQNAIHVTWKDFRDGNSEIYYKRSTNNGQNWTSGIRLTNDAGGSNYPAVACHNQNVHVVWSDDRDGNFEIYYKLSSDNGNTWGPDIRLTNDSSESECPKILRSNNYIHVVWNDNRDGNYEIYYKRGILDGAIEEEPVQNIKHACLSTSMISNAAVITYQIPERAKVNLTVYDLLGTQVRTLVDATKESGFHTVHWNGCSDDGNQLANGVYFCRMQAGAFRATEKLLLLR